VLERAGAARICDDAMDAAKNADRLTPLLEGLLYDAAARKVMSDNARKIGRPDAAKNVAEVLSEMIPTDR
jgi:UDP-N-acetylglucosamine:LPS N-acetylglucosamine transferase